MMENTRRKFRKSVNKRRPTNVQNMQRVQRYRSNAKRDAESRDRYASLRNRNKRDHYKKSSIVGKPKLIYKRYRCSNKKLDFQYIEQHLAQEDSTGEKIIDIDALKSEFRGKTKQESNEERYKAAENLIAFEQLSNLPGYRFVMPENHYEYLEIKSDPGHYRSIDIARDKYAAENAFMIHGNKLYHNDYRKVLPCDDIKPLEIIYTKRCNPDDFETITLKDWLKTVYDMKIHELENLY